MQEQVPVVHDEPRAVSRPERDVATVTADLWVEAGGGAEPIEVVVAIEGDPLSRLPVVDEHEVARPIVDALVGIRGVLRNRDLVPDAVGDVAAVVADRIAAEVGVIAEVDAVERVDASVARSWTHTNWL